LLRSAAAIGLPGDRHRHVAIQDRKQSDALAAIAGDAGITHAKTLEHQRKRRFWILAVAIRSPEIESIHIGGFVVAEDTNHRDVLERRQFVLGVKRVELIGLHVISAQGGTNAGVSFTKELVKPALQKAAVPGFIGVAGLIDFNGKGGISSLNVTVNYVDDDVIANNTADNFTCILTTPSDAAYSNSTGLLTLTVGSNDNCFTPIGPASESGDSACNTNNNPHNTTVRFALVLLF
jgi:hypothetical protein